MAAALDTLKSDIEAAERDVYLADQRASAQSRALRTYWRSKAPTVVGVAGAALLLRQLLKTRRNVSRNRVPGEGGSSWMRTYGPYVSALGPQAITAVSALVAAVVAKNAKKQLASAAHVDLDRFVGSWHEIASLPEKYDHNSVSDTRATFGRTDDGLRLLSLSRRGNGSIKRSTGRAKLADDATQARFKISYSPPALDFLPFVWSDYTIIDVADDYSTALVGTADRKHLWLLARQPFLAEHTRTDFLNKARAQGFDTSALRYTLQSERPAPAH